MRHQLALAAVLVALTASACSSAGDDLVGRWALDEDWIVETAGDDEALLERFRQTFLIISAGSIYQDSPNDVVLLPLKRATSVVAGVEEGGNWTGLVLTSGDFAIQVMINKDRLIWHAAPGGLRVRLN